MKERRSGRAFALKLRCSFLHAARGQPLPVSAAGSGRRCCTGAFVAPPAAVPGDDFIATLRAWAGDQRRQHAVLLYAFYAAPQPPGHPVLPRGRLELDLLFQRPVCRRRRHRALAVAGAAAALNIFCQKALTTANAHDRITGDFERRRRTGSFQSNFPMDRPAGLRPYGQPGPLPTGGASRHY